MEIRPVFHPLTLEILPLLQHSKDAAEVKRCHHLDLLESGGNRCYHQIRDSPNLGILLPNLKILLPNLKILMPNLEIALVSNLVVTDSLNKGVSKIVMQMPLPMSILQTTHIYNMPRHPYYLPQVAKYIYTTMINSVQ